MADNLNLIDIAKMREMVDTLNKWSREYYELDAPSVPDTEYDALYDRLAALEAQAGFVLPDSPTKRVGGAPKAAFARHTHLSRLFSLDKAQTFGALEAWHAKTCEKAPDADFTVELKYDGLNITATYQNGVLACLSTRGNGIVGEDITSRAAAISNLPRSISHMGMVELCGECIMRLSDLDRYNAAHPDAPLKNARNAAAGALRALDVEQLREKKLEGVFYSVNYAENLPAGSQTELVKWLKSNGFQTNYVFERAKTLEEMRAVIEKINGERGSYDFLTDGAVVKVNDFSLREKLGATDKFPRWALAFKFEAEEVQTELQGVVWQVGRTGKLTPLALLAPVEICGATISRATLNNMGDIERKNLSLGCTVILRRSNDVIPEILGAVTNSSTTYSARILPPSVCPSCGAALAEKGAHIFCPNRQSCPEQIVSKLTHFASKNACDIEGLSEKTALQLFESLGVNSPEKLFELTLPALLSLEGFKEKKAQNLISAIEKCKQTPLENFIFALGIDNIGIVAARELAREFQSVDALAAAKAADLLHLNLFGEIVAESVEAFFADPQNLQIVRALQNCGMTAAYTPPVAPKNAATDPFYNKKIVLTGSLTTMSRSEAEKLLIQRGATVLSAVTKSCSMVIAGENAGSKLAKAQALKIKIVDENTFKDLLNN